MAAAPAPGAASELKPVVDKSFTHRGYSFVARQSAMLESTVADEVGRASGVHPQPCMLFDSVLTVTDPAGRVLLNIDTADALRGCRLQERAAGDAELAKIGSVQCQFAQSWAGARKAQIDGVATVTTNTDWTFTSSYAPEGCAAAGEDAGWLGESISESALPMELLACRDDPILWYQSVFFWEDELDDSGNSQMELKIRVQDKFFYVLMRNEIRVDQVVARRVDNRFFGVLEPLSCFSAAPGEVYREFSFTEASFAELTARGDLQPDRLEMVPQVCSMLKPTDTKIMTARTFRVKE
eukprot:TRINITY_DN47428_c0_g1_i1.p1 TRINITY_DN47428_c0_g1~~TRINITY_DN47428_c0_g1_i1.p1  ORF type:complete len:296 (-),score=63.51 TRINITY_DN47428_c0_g1_i1:167-1054(-)